MMFMNLIWAWGHPEALYSHSARLRRILGSGFDVFRQTVVRLPLDGRRDHGHLYPVFHRLAAPLLHDGVPVPRQCDLRYRFDGIYCGAHGVKVFNWLFTNDGGRIVYSTPILWSLGFMVTFVIGGMTGAPVAVPPVDFVFNSVFLVAHFHNVIIGGVLFGAFAGYTYRFPSFRLHEGLGKAAFWC